MLFIEKTITLLKTSQNQEKHEAGYKTRLIKNMQMTTSS